MLNVASDVFYISWYDKKVPFLGVFYTKHGTGAMLGIKNLNKSVCKYKTMETYKILKPVATIIRPEPTAIITTSLLTTRPQPQRTHLFNTMEEYNALAKMGRFEPSKALIDIACRRHRQKNDIKIDY